MQTTNWRQTLYKAPLEDENLRQALLQSLDALAGHQQRILGELANDVKKYFQQRQTTCQIDVLLVSSEERGKLLNFFPVPEEFAATLSTKSRSIYYKETEYLGGAFFLNCAYEDVAAYCAREYRGHAAEGDFRYRLVPHGRFVRLEHYLARLFNLYNLAALPVFSPYARRAVDICLLDEVVKPHEADFAWAENNLPMFSDRVLLWNIKVHETVDGASYDHADEQKIYRFDANEQSYILPLYLNSGTHDYDVVTQRDGYEIVLTTSSNTLSGKGIPWEFFPTENVALPVNAEIFTNEPSCRSHLPLRINTRGDIDHVLTQLRQTIGQEEYNAAFAAWDETADNCFAPYAAKVAYPVSTDQELVRRRQKLPVCMVKFSGERKYLADYANWALYVLNRQYPEFNWAGVPA